MSANCAAVLSKCAQDISGSVADLAMDVYYGLSSCEG